MILVQTQFKGNIHFLTLSGVQGSGAFITVSWAAERVSSTLPLSPGWLEQSWVSLASPGPEKPEITYRHLGTLGKHLGTPGNAWRCLGMSGDILAPPGTAWSTLDHPGPSWHLDTQENTVLKVHTGLSFTDMLISVISHFKTCEKCHFCHFWPKCHFLAFMAILTPGPTLATKNVTGCTGT